MNTRSAPIVVLDGFTLNPGDLSWDALRALGPCTIHDRTAPGQTVARAQDAAVVLTNKVVLSGEVIAQLPRLRYIGVLATGYNVVELAAASERGIVVTNVPEYGTASVAQMTFALLLELAQQVGHHAATVRDGRWASSRDFCYWDHPLTELSGLTMGIVGFGRIGRAVARIADALGMRVLANSRGVPPELPSYVRRVDLETLCRECDVLSLHCALTAENKGLVNARLLGWLKPTAWLINTSRGPLINEADLAAALNARRLAGAALDVLGVEPPAADNPLLGARNCIITPHIAWATLAARRRLMAVAVDNVRAFLAGHPQHVVNPKTLVY